MRKPIFAYKSLAAF